MVVFGFLGKFEEVGKCGMSAFDWLLWAIGELGGFLEWLFPFKE